MPPTEPNAGLAPSAVAGPKLSVIVPVYNERYLVAELLRHLLAAPLPSVGEREVIVVDDGSTDGSAEIVRRLAETADCVRLIEQPENRGKGAAVRAGIATSTGDLVVFQDADLEYDPRDLELLARRFAEAGAQVVYGTRFRTPGRRIVSYRHELGNRLITVLTNLLTGLRLTDVETCYKMFRGPLLRGIPLCSDDFAIEVEITVKLARRRIPILEVPVRYQGRTHGEGKKITWRDGVWALAALARFRLGDGAPRAGGGGQEKRPAPKGRPESPEAS